MFTWIARKILPGMKDHTVDFTSHFFRRTTWTEKIILWSTLLWIVSLIFNLIFANFEANGAPLHSGQYIECTTDTDCLEKHGWDLDGQKVPLPTVHSVNGAETGRQEDGHPKSPQTITYHHPRRKQ